MIEIGLHVRNPRDRRIAVHGIDTLLQRRIDGRWRSLFHMHHPLPGATAVPDPVPVDKPNHLVLSIGFLAGRAFPVGLPAVEPGVYRLAKRMNMRGPERWVTAVIAILPPVSPSSCAICPHG